MVNPGDWPRIPQYSSEWIEWQVVMSKFLQGRAIHTPGMRNILK